MYFIVARLSGHVPATQEESSALRQKIILTAGPEDGVQHVYARPGKSGMDLVLFVVGATVEAAEADARRMLDAALEATALPFEVRSCGVDLVIPAAEALLDRED